MSRTIDPNLRFSDVEHREALTILRKIADDSEVSKQILLHSIADHFEVTLGLEEEA